MLFRSVIFTAVRIAQELNLKYAIVQGTSGHLVADILKDEDCKIISGPYLSDRSKPELSDLTPKSPVILNNQGLDICISTDHPETPLKFYLNCGIEAVRHGMSEEDALRCMTINGAKLGGIDQRVGSIEVGKDGDIIIFDGNPFNYKSILKKKTPYNTNGQR